VRLLLDTHTVLWLLGDPGRIAPEARRHIEDLSNAVLISAVCAWEIATKVASSRLGADPRALSSHLR
jgi:PIN domain nuclease of toxin-antitoxin system